MRRSQTWMRSRKLQWGRVVELISSHGLDGSGVREWLPWSFPEVDLHDLRFESPNQLFMQSESMSTGIGLRYCLNASVSCVFSAFPSFQVSDYNQMRYDAHCALYLQISFAGRDRWKRSGEDPSNVFWRKGGGTFGWFAVAGRGVVVFVRRQMSSR